MLFRSYNLVRNIFFYGAHEARGKAGNTNLDYIQKRVDEAKASLTEHNANKKDTEQWKYILTLKQQELAKWEEQQKYFSNISKAFDSETINTPEGFKKFYDTHLMARVNGKLNDYHIVRAFTSAYKSIDETKYILAYDARDNSYHMVLASSIPKDYKGVEGIPSLNRFLVTTAIDKHDDTKTKQVQNTLDANKEGTTWEIGRASCRERV